MIKMIFAIAEPNYNGYPFGLDNGLPWAKNAEDMAWFKEYTKNSVLCCSQKTADTLPKSVYTTNGRSLFILNRNHTYNDLPDNSIIIGGAEVIKSWHQVVDEISVTMIDKEYQADTYLHTDILSDIFYYRQLQRSVKLNDTTEAFIYR